MLDDPFRQTRDHPEAIDAQRDDREEPPLDVVAEEPSTGSSENDPAPVDQRVLCLPAVPHAQRPGKSQAKGEHGQKELGETHQKEAPSAAIELEALGYGDLKLLRVARDGQILLRHAVSV